MGNWNWRSRRRYHQKAVTSPTRWYQPEIPPSIPTSGCQDNVPSWEKKFCASVGIPWWKVLEAKKFMHCHTNIVNWNDSAGEETFNNAKRRCWAEINGLACDILLPDPDTYIDKIDWNPFIDPELVSALDREYVCPDEVERITRENANRHRKNPENGDNPWECGNLEHNEEFKIQATGWGQWDNCINESNELYYNDCPWENSYKGNISEKKSWGDLPDKSRDWREDKCANPSTNLYRYSLGNGAVQNKALRDCKDKSWGWNGGENCTDQSNILDNNNNPWGSSCLGGLPVTDKRQGNCADFSWREKGWENRIVESGKFKKGGNPWEYGFIANSNTGMRDGGWSREQWGNNRSNEPKDLEPKIGNFGRGGWNGGSRKREGSLQYFPRYKNFRFQVDDQQMGGYKRRGGNNG